MGRIPHLWFWSARQQFCTRMNGKRIILGKDKDIAEQTFNLLMIDYKTNMAKPHKLWLRTKNNIYYTTINGKQIDLGKDKDIAQQKFDLLIADFKNNNTIIIKPCILDKEFNRIKTLAIKRNIGFYISINDIDNLYLKQNKKCALTKVDLLFNSRTKLGNASIDRIDSDKDYIKSNIQLVLKNINLAKRTLSQEDFIKMCKQVAKNND